MRLEELEMGDIVFAARDILDDGSMPGAVEGDMLAAEGTRGVIVNIGHLEENPNVDVFLVRFEDQNLDLGNPIGCYKDDLKVAELDS